MSDSIFIREARFPCRIGVTPEERASPQDVLIDVELRIDLRSAGATDSIKQTVDYTDAWQTVHDCVTSHEYHLVEALARGVADALLARHPLLDGVVVRASKPAALASRGVGGAGVQLSVNRDDHGR